MSERSELETLDHIIPVIRKKAYVDFEPTTTVFRYDKESVSTRVLEKVSGDGKVISETQTIKESRKEKITLKVYSQSTSEDCEHYFEALECLQRELEEEYMTISSNKTNNAKLLFHAHDKMLAGTALSEWHDTIAGREAVTWEDFKTLVAKFITTKVLKDNAFIRQQSYLENRPKPHNLPVKMWWLRIQTLNRYLPYFIKDMDMLKKWYPEANFSHWWKLGSYSETELKHKIVLVRIPYNWRQALAVNDIGRTHQEARSVDDLVDYFTVIEDQEINRNRKQNQNQQNRQGRNFTRGRNNNWNRGNAINTYRGNAINTGREWPRYNNQSPVRPYSAGRYNPNNYQNAQGRDGPNRNNQSYYSTGSQHQGGRGRATNWRGGRMTGGRFGGQRSGRPAPPQQTYYQNENTAEEYYEETNQVEEAATATEQVGIEDDLYYENVEQLANAWNESLYLDDTFDYGGEYDGQYGEDAYYDDGNEPYDQQCG